MTLYLTNRVAVLESCSQRLKAFLNSSGLMEPPPSWSSISKSCIRSSSSMSITRNRLWNSGTVRAPCSSSSRLSSPLLSSSIFPKILVRIFKSCSCSISMSIARAMTSLSRCSAKVSTTTATTRFSTPKTRVREEPTKIMAVQGCASMTGTATRPQLSPAMTVLNKVRFACITVANARSHVGQFSLQSPSAASFATMGCSSSTAAMAQTVMMTKQNRKDQQSVLKQLAVIRHSLRSSFSQTNLRNKRMRRIIRISLRSLSRPN
mmetsp:Transcript_54068/g.97397  ORF Transcript_54068/g.97397 Transcript_54068/m.97397 type:complete len:263 (-) Transcript_54068:798-1586(-)